MSESYAPDLAAAGHQDGEVKHLKSDGSAVVWSNRAGGYISPDKAKLWGIKLAAQPGAGPAPGGELAGNPDYQKYFAQWLGKQDAESMGKAKEAMHSAMGQVDEAQQARDLIAAGTPTGFGGTVQMLAGKALGGFLGGHGGIPTTEQATNMASLRRLGGKGTLGDVQYMKGSLSDADRQFLQSMQYGVDQDPRYNLKVADAQSWAAKKQIAYAAGLQAWVNKLGSPAAVAKSGQTFDQWWDGYAAKNLPRPDIVSRPRDEKNAKLKAKSAGGEADPLGLR
jgi:hypothetical protein